MGAVYDFYPVTERPELRILVDGTAERMAPAIAHIHEVGDVFWAHELGSDKARIPQTIKNKMSILRETISLVPNIDDDAYMDAWLKMERHVTAEEVATLQQRRMGVILPPEIKSKFRRAPETALQAYKTPAIHDMVHQHLSFTGDPVVIIVDKFTDYERNKPQTNERSRALGYSALEMFAFGAGGQRLVDVIGAANLQFHEDELQRRSITKVK